MALASSSSQVPGESQHAGAHSGLTHPVAGPLDAAPSASSGEVTGEVPFVSRARCGWCSLILREGVLPETTGICPECLAKQREEDRVRQERRAQAGTPPSPVPVAPLHAEIAPLGGFCVVDVNGFVVAQGLTWWNSAVAIATILDRALRYDGICLLHLSETVGGRCLSCTLGTSRNAFSAVPR
jgi:hypothetical protein